MPPRPSSARRSHHRRASSSATSSPHVPSNIYSTVARLITYGPRHDFEMPFSVTDRFPMYGTGFFVDGDAHLLTCAHCIDDASEVFVEIPTEGRRQFKATVLGICPEFDLGMLRVEGYTNTEWCKLDEHNAVRVRPGDTTMVVGYPLGASNLKQTKGIISGQQRNRYQTDAAINPGNSGGPMFRNGHVIGINDSGMNGVDVDNVGFAVPIARYVMVADLLRKPKRIVHFPRSLGFRFQPTYPEWFEYTGSRCGRAQGRSGSRRKPLTTGGRRSQSQRAGLCGVHVTHVYKDSVLARTGLKKGDVLCRVDGMDVDAFGELPRRWMNQRMTLDNLRCTLPLGRRVPIEYWSTKERTLVRTAFVMRERSLPVRKMYPLFEPLDYVVYGGMVLMPLCLNHTTMYFNGKNKYIAPALRKYQSAKHCHEPTVVLSKMLQGSFLSTLQLFDDDPRIVTAINHHSVKTLADVRRALSKPVVRKGRKYVHVVTADDETVVLPVDVVESEEARLCQKYKYPRGGGR